MICLVFQAHSDWQEIYIVSPVYFIFVIKLLVVGQSQYIDNIHGKLLVKFVIIIIISLAKYLVCSITNTTQTRTPAFWDTPAAPWLPILVIHIRSQVKQDKVKVTNLKENAKILNFKIWQETLHATHLLKLLCKMYNYEMDPTRTVGFTERTYDAGPTRDGRTDRWPDGVKPIYHNNFVVRGGTITQHLV